MPVHKVKGGYKIKSYPKVYTSKKAAVKRERQMHYFKNKGK